MAILLLLSLNAISLPAMAQTLHGLTVGEDLLPALKHMPKTQNFGQVGSYVAIKWTLPNGNGFSATASPATGKIVYLEEDQAAASPSNDLPLSGLVLGASTLNDIRHRFGSNGMGFASNAETLQGGVLIGINCYELRHAPGVFLVFVTRLSPSDETGEPAPSHLITGDGILVSVIVAEKTYLQEIWGDQLLTDPHYTPIDVPGLVAND
jgi:hypothetical protein